MTARAPRFRRLIVSGVLLLGLTGLIAAGSSAMKVHFFADFNTPDEGSAIKAEIGTLEQLAVATSFEVLFSAPDQGLLRISENHTGTPARLRAELTTPVESSVALVQFRLKPVGAFGSLEVSLAEDGESGMIDLTFTPEGRVRAGNQVGDLPGLPGHEFEVYIELTELLFGNTRYEVKVLGPFGTTVLQGELDLSGADLGIIDFIQPGSTNSGVWDVDDVLVTSSVPKLFKLFGGALNLSL